MRISDVCEYIDIFVPGLCRLEDPDIKLGASSGGDATARESAAEPPPDHSNHQAHHHHRYQLDGIT